jgi:hypothetical protein
MFQQSAQKCSLRRQIGQFHGLNREQSIVYEGKQIPNRQPHKRDRTNNKGLMYTQVGYKIAFHRAQVRRDPGTPSTFRRFRDLADRT